MTLLKVILNITATVAIINIAIMLNDTIINKY